MTEYEPMFDLNILNSKSVQDLNVMNSKSVQDLTPRASTFNQNQYLIPKKPQPGSRKSSPKVIKMTYDAPVTNQVTFSTNEQMKEASQPEVPNVKAEYKSASYNDLMQFHNQEYNEIAKQR